MDLILGQLSDGSACKEESDGPSAPINSSLSAEVLGQTYAIQGEWYESAEASARLLAVARGRG